MHGRGRSHRWLVHLMAGAALGAAVVLVVWILSGGRPFGEVVGGGDVSSPTPAPAERAGTGQEAGSAARLASRPPTALERNAAAAGELRFRKPKAKAGQRAAKAERKVATRKPRRTQRRKRRGPAVRVVAPPVETPAVAVPSPAPTAAPKPAAPKPQSGAGGGSAKPKAPGPTLWAGEG